MYVCMYIVLKNHYLGFYSIIIQCNVSLLETQIEEASGIKTMILVPGISLIFTSEREEPFKKFKLGLKVSL